MKGYLMVMPEEEFNAWLKERAIELRWERKSMSETSHAAVHAAPTGFIRKYVFSLDHKVIGIQYYFLALIAAFLGMALSLIFRLRLAWPTETLAPAGEDFSSRL